MADDASTVERTGQDSPGLPAGEAADRTHHARWCGISADAVATQLHVDAASGLSRPEVERRLLDTGANVIKDQHAVRPAMMVFEQFRDVMILILIGAAIVSGIVGEAQDAIAILVIVILNAAVGVIQAYRAERALEALRSLATPLARVRRGGQTLTIAASELVPGDVVFLEAGNGVPADLRLIDAHQLSTDESTLTGESEPVEKHVAAIDAEHISTGEHLNLVFKGSHVTRGRATGIVIATGVATKLGQIAELLRSTEISKTPLQKRLARFGRRLAVVVLAICLLIFASGLLRGEPLVLMFLTAVSLAVAAIPEALPAVVTVSLALGARKMVRARALVRRLPAVETLGSTTFICADKTGTLTENRMRVDFVQAGDVRHGQLGPEIEDRSPHFGLALALNNDVQVSDTGDTSGDPTEVALYEFAKAGGYNGHELANEYSRIREVPFDSDTKCMVTVHECGDDVVAFLKGAPEAVIQRSSEAADPTLPFDPVAILENAEAIASDGYRVLAAAEKCLSRQDDQDNAGSVDAGFSFLGLVALIDPPRAGVAQAVSECRSAGITPVMITGDHPATALAIARRVGIAGEHATVITGKELASLDPADLNTRTIDARVYARVDPAQKIGIVDALQRRGEFVAMTGDGVNDAPALKKADIGVAMGQSGTDVAREAADMILMDDNFATIVAAVREGRRIFDNILKFIKYTMSSNSGEIWAMVLAPFLGLPIPLLPIHILWINLVTDGLPGLALAAESGERSLMSRPPRPPQQSVFARDMWQHILWVGLLIGGLTIAGQAWAIEQRSANWQTMAFTVLTLSQLAHVLAVRSYQDSVFSQRFWANRPLLGAVALTILLQLAVLYAPPLQQIFNTSALSYGELGVCLALSAVVLFAAEVEKFLQRRRLIYAEHGEAVRSCSDE